MGEYDISVSVDKLKFVEEPVGTSTRPPRARRLPPVRLRRTRRTATPTIGVPDHAVMSGYKGQLKAPSYFEYSDYN